MAQEMADGLIMAGLGVRSRVIGPTARPHVSIPASTTDFKRVMYNRVKRQLHHSYAMIVVYCFWCPGKERLYHSPSAMRQAEVRRQGHRVLDHIEPFAYIVRYLTK